MKRNILITGSSHGIGAGCAIAFARDEGANIGITCNKNPEGAKAVAAECEKYGVKTKIYAGDVGKHDHCKAMVEDFIATFGKIDVLVNNAGAGGKILPLAEQTDDDLSRTVAVNLTGAMMGCARAARAMIARGKGGAIVNVSSVCALYAWPGWGVYTAAKAGLSKFSHALYAELRPHGIRVTCVTPSWGRTGFNAAAGIRGASEDRALAKLCIQPEDLGRIVRGILEQPDHLAVPELTVLPQVQDIVPM